MDLAVGCTYKYLNAGPGAPAFLYVSARLREVLRQPIWGWFSQRDQFAMGPRYDPAPGMAKFMTGTPSILGTAAVEEGARLLLEAGLGPMRAKSLRLTSYLIELGDAWLSRSAARSPRRGRPAAAAATSPSAIRRPSDRRAAGRRRHHRRLPHPGPVPARPVPAHHALHRRVGRRPSAARDIIETKRYADHG